ncbi:MAG: xanthan lyase, partial [Bacteroidales bacterium]
RSNGWADDDAPGFGTSYADWEDKVVPGNTFDYPIIHGKAFARAGYSYVSTSLEVFTETDKYNTADFHALDLILGKQKQVTRGGTLTTRTDFKAFPPSLQVKLTQYARKGGNMLISGAYTTSDIWGSYQKDSLGRIFAQEVLRVNHRSNHASRTGEVMTAPSPYKAFYDEDLSGDPVYSFCTDLNQDIYPVESPDALEPASEDAYTILRYLDNRLSAGVAYKGAYRVVVLGFPLETLKTTEQQERLVKQCLEFFGTDN